jgi:hypothetical protein
MSLFQTDAWQSAWWDTWGNTPGFELIRPWDGHVSGLYKARYRFKGFPISSLLFVGTNHRTIATVRTEYNQFSQPNMPAHEIAAVIEGLLSSTNWTEAVFADMSTGSPEMLALEALSKNKRWMWRPLEDDICYSINATGNFESYLGSLGTNTRLRLFNRRKVLESLGEMELKEAWPHATANFFQTLNDLHEERWGSRFFGGDKGMAFNDLFLKRIVAEGGEPNLSILCCDGRPLSTLYNVLYRGRVYNLQAGFEQAFHKKLALGTLHLGYCIEQSFLDPKVHCFDMLAGTGKKEDYKARLATDQETFKTVMLVKNPFFKWLYKLKGQG